MSMQDAIARLVAVTPQLTDDLDQPALTAAMGLLDELVIPLSEEDVTALVSILPASGDTASGLNWTILHYVEAAPSWPIWATLQNQSHEWVQIMRLRLGNVGILEPTQ